MTFVSDCWCQTCCRQLERVRTEAGPSIYLGYKHYTVVRTVLMLVVNSCLHRRARGEIPRGRKILSLKMGQPVSSTNLDDSLGSAFAS